MRLLTLILFIWLTSLPAIANECGDVAQQRTERVAFSEVGLQIEAIGQIIASINDKKGMNASNHAKKLASAALGFPNTGDVFAAVSFTNNILTSRDFEAGQRFLVAVMEQLGDPIAVPAYDLWSRTTLFLATGRKLLDWDKRRDLMSSYEKALNSFSQCESERFSVDVILAEETLVRFDRERGREQLLGLEATANSSPVASEKGQPVQWERHLTLFRTYLMTNRFESAERTLAALKQAGQAYHQTTADNPDLANRRKGLREQELAAVELLHQARSSRHLDKQNAWPGQFIDRSFGRGITPGNMVEHRYWWLLNGHEPGSLLK